MSAKTKIDRLQHFYQEQDNLPALKQVAERYAVGVSETMLRTIKSAGDPVGKQYLPSTAELSVTPEESLDPIGDETHSPVPGIVHRYPDRVLLMPVRVCAVYCRFCFRREHVGPGQAQLSPGELESALDYIRSNSGIWEVILSGGDPLVLSPRRLKAILDELHTIPHVRVIRIHSRVPVADPVRVTDELCAVLATDKPLYLSVHVNHVDEITPEAETVLRALHQAGCVLLSQSVLLRGVNDSVEALENLFRRLVELRVKPYYLHHPDLAAGTEHFRLPLEEGQALAGALRGRLSGIAIPSYMLDIPGGYGKVPVGPNHVCVQSDGRAVLTDPRGNAHVYPPSRREG